MPISKKDRIHREQKKADAAGTRAKVNPNGTPVKAAKPKSICAFCRKELVSFLFSFYVSFSFALLVAWIDFSSGE